MFIGILLLALGALMLLDRLGVITGGLGQWIVPVALIALGVDFMTKSFRRKH